MRFTVTWTKSSVRDLGEAWLASSDRNGTSAASVEIDRILRDDLHLKGNEVAEGLRGVNVPPLRFLFSVNIDDRVVEIAVVREL